MLYDAGCVSTANMRGMRTFKGHAGNLFMLFDYAEGQGVAGCVGAALGSPGVRVCPGCAGCVGCAGVCRVCRGVPGCAGCAGCAGECRAFARICLQKFCHFVLRFVSCCIDKIQDLMTIDIVFFWNASLLDKTLSDIFGGQ